MKRTPNLPELKRLNLIVQAQVKIPKGDRIWNQEFWATLADTSDPMCRTAFCLAGLTLVRAGHEFRTDGNRCLFIDGEEVSFGTIAHRADEILGINHGCGYYCNHNDDDDAEEMTVDLYDGDNSAADIDRQIKLIFERDGANYQRTKAAPDMKIEIIGPVGAETTRG